jgi:hypothetical protein
VVLNGSHLYTGIRRWGNFLLFLLLLIFDVPAMAVFQDGSLFQPQMSARAAKMALDNVVKRTGSGLGPIKLGEGPRYGCTFQ